LTFINKFIELFVIRTATSRQYPLSASNDAGRSALLGRENSEPASFRPIVTRESVGNFADDVLDVALIQMSIARDERRCTCRL
jgi:hypothetical protein